MKRQLRTQCFLAALAALAARAASTAILALLIGMAVNAAQAQVHGCPALHRCLVSCADGVLAGATGKVIEACNVRCLKTDDCSDGHVSQTPSMKKARACAKLHTCLVGCTQPVLSAGNNDQLAACNRGCFGANGQCQRKIALAAPASDLPLAEIEALFVKTDFITNDNGSLRTSVRGGKYLFLEGTINSKSNKKIRKILRDHPAVRTLVLTSVPGSTGDDSYLELGKFINRRGLSTYVPSKGSVSSGGTDLFLAGKRRILGKDAEVGVHSWSDDDGSGSGEKHGKDIRRDHDLHKPFLDYYPAIKIPIAFYWYTLEFDPDGMHWMSHDEMKKYRVFTDLVD
jgi:hypothetical protein